MDPLTPPVESYGDLLDGGTYTSVPGTAVGVCAAGIKSSDRLDVAVLVADGVAAGMTTTSTAASAPCVWTRSILPGPLMAVVVNAGNANAATGQQGVDDCRAMRMAVSELLGSDSSRIAVCSTGVIGVPMPMQRVIPGVKMAAADLSATGHDAAKAIITTDLVTKEAAARVDGITVGGIAKGSGMIHPNMGTMLAFLATDASVEADVLQSVLKEVVDVTFNAITVDGDQSTSDTVILQATGQSVDVRSDTHQYNALRVALYTVCRHLARSIARDGEGARRLISVIVEGLDNRLAQQAALVVARSPLVKTAVHGCDANWGRVVGALGAAGVDGLDRVDLDFAGVPVVRNGRPIAFDEEAASAALAADEVIIHARLAGDGVGRAWGCDLSADYVRINADYRS
jgi:glutamate N-acetyltransferase/amino-acid N-acetyltransferase